MPSTPFKGYALVDCNNFFVSCERVFKPHLNYKPVVVLSSNDGCIISRSQEVKDLKIPMGAPVFLYKELILRHDIKAFSSNFKLYGDLSDRVMQVIALFSPDLEIYSIDEAFIPITIQNESDLLNLREQILKWTGIPVSIGLGATKTLAKAANFYAKKNKLKCFSLLDQDPDPILAQIPIHEVWGIGNRSAKKLIPQSISTALHFKKASEHWVRKKMNLPGLRTLLELRGSPCYLPEVEDPKRKSLVYSKSFGRVITSYNELSEAVSHYVAQAACKIRKKGYLAKLLSLYLKTKEECFFETLSLKLPSSSTLVYNEAAQYLLKKLFKERSYLKVGIYLADLTLEKNQQYDLHEQEDPKFAALMKTIDSVNKKYGFNTLHFAGEGLSRPWTCKREYLTQEYTTHWDKILRIQL